jgi:hypothetical protein
MSRHIAMTVHFDTTAGTWRIIASDGRIVMDGFRNAAAWAWADKHEADQAHAVLIPKEDHDERD